MKTYDFGLNWDKGKCSFTDALQSDCRKKGLSFIWVTQKDVRRLSRELEAGKIRIRVILDTEATYDIPGEPYARLNYAVKDSGGIVINDPDRTRRAIDKSVMHYELMDSGIPIPFTVVLRNWEPRKFKLTAEERKKLGVPFIIKPACGWGHQGVIYDATGSISEIAEARDYDPGDNFLLQERITPMRLGGKKAWYRVFHVFDKIIPCWWDDASGWYDHMTLDEFRKFKLQPIVRYVARIAGITKMAWFSTELAVDKKNDTQRIMAIDYVNDQCDMETRTENLSSGVPDRIVKFTAYSMIHYAAGIISDKNHGRDRRYTVLFARNDSLGMKGLGQAPDLLKQ
jgi:hypothetical protein